MEHLTRSELAVGGLFVKVTDYLGTEIAIKMIKIPDEGLTTKTLTEVSILS